MVKLNKIYTRTGDDGTTGLVGGGRISKADPLMAAIGDVDEANSAIGVALVSIDDENAATHLRRVQNELFDLGADLATPLDIEGGLRVTAEQVDRLEREIDAMNAALSPLTSFVLPGGAAGAAQLHLARAIVRRAERSAVAAAVNNALNPKALTYINRLSDWLFVAARRLNNLGASDVLWVPGASR
ncbi:cob(I)yrinic acid a,c-diamide adenosyltransferase [Sphingomonas asaccharolytica]|uniref:cob(I)yrinic acid a,c-diamide adenosyltransferase n=1 Tax=Sphingomonas asaccharolytica TaxID=40681 RepID=UPI000836EB73|nr:cob(I)yrinic acid a,c-diamide adenosyltransferase [Sphingomonas asaccharolytica]